MSVRAYKIIEIKTEKEPTFNCWHDERVMELASNREHYSDGGDLSFCKDDVKIALKEEKALPKTQQDAEYIDILKQIIKDADGEDYVDYYCY